jgi:hypothetical protein
MCIYKNICPITKIDRVTSYRLITKVSHINMSTSQTLQSFASMASQAREDSFKHREEIRRQKAEKLGRHATALAKELYENLNTEQKISEIVEQARQGKSWSLIFSFFTPAFTQRQVSDPVTGEEVTEKQLVVPQGETFYCELGEDINTEASSMSSLFLTQSDDQRRVYPTTGNVVEQLNEMLNSSGSLYEGHNCRVYVRKITDREYQVPQFNHDGTPRVHTHGQRAGEQQTRPATKFLVLLVWDHDEYAKFLERKEEASRQRMEARQAQRESYQSSRQPRVHGTRRRRPAQSSQ